MLSNRQSHQIRHFRQIRRFPDTPSFALRLKSKTEWRNVVKSSVSPNSPISSNSPLSRYPFFRSLSQSKFLWRNVVKMVSFTKFAIFVEFAAFWITPSFARHLKSKSLWQISSNRHFPQIRHFRRNRSFPDTPSFARCLKSKFLWRNVVK